MEKYIKDIMMRGTMPDVVTRELSSNGMFKNHEISWAVRSSSNVEDLSTASFAGQYDTYLHVRGQKDLEKSIKKCWASLWNERALSYRDKFSIDHYDAAMAVIIQHMVEAKYSGVIFTRDPKYPEIDEMILEYCPGMGDELVSGRITPMMCRLSRPSVSVISPITMEVKGLETHQLDDIGRLALNIENDFGCPQDIEWVYDGTEYHVLQTRPIVKAKNELIELDQLWTRANVGEVLPDVITPLTWSIFRATLLDQPELALQFQGPVTDDSDHTGISVLKGRVYIRLKGFLDSYCYLPFVTPKIMYDVLGVQLPKNASLYERPSGILVSLAKVLYFLNATLLFPIVERRVARLKPPKIQSLDGIKEVLQWTAKCFKLHLRITGYTIASFACLNTLRDPEKEADKVTGVMTNLLRGPGDYQTAAQGINLWEISRSIKQNNTLKRLIETDMTWGELKEVAQLTSDGRELLHKLESFLQENGARAAGEFELSVPRWREDPSFVLHIVRRLLESDRSINVVSNILSGNKHGEKILREAESTIQNPFKRLLFRVVLGSFTVFSAQRENLKYQLMEGYYLLRTLYLNLGEELQRRGLLEAREDVFYLTAQEIEALKEGILFSDTYSKINSRKEERSKWKAKPAPDLLLKAGHSFEINSKEIYSNAGLRGIGCSAGIVAGYARVLFDVRDSTSMKQDEILITRFTDPGWTPLFLTCKAVVTEIGGFLSHGATVAREYGIPCIVNVPGVTELVRTGDLIRVDGGNGKIEILKKKDVESG